MKPDISSKVSENQLKQKSYHDRSAKQRDINIGDSVFARIYGSWLPGSVIKKNNDYSGIIKLLDGRVFRRHIDHIILRYCEPPGSIPTQASENYSKIRLDAPSVHTNVDIDMPILTPISPAKIRNSDVLPHRDKEIPPVRTSGLAANSNSEVAQTSESATNSSAESDSAPRRSNRKARSPDRLTYTM